MVIVFFLAEDRESGQIVDDAYLTPLDTETWSDKWFTKAGRRLAAEMGARRQCDGWDLKLIDFDWGSETLWRLGFCRPKWGTDYYSPPPGIAADRWRKRFKSTDELKAYRAGVEATKASKSRKR